MSALPSPLSHPLPEPLPLQSISIFWIGIRCGHHIRNRVEDLGRSPVPFGLSRPRQSQGTRILWIQHTINPINPINPLPSRMAQGGPVCKLRRTISANEAETPLAFRVDSASSTPLDRAVPYQTRSVALFLSSDSALLQIRFLLAPRSHIRLSASLACARVPQTLFRCPSVPYSRLINPLANMSSDSTPPAWCNSSANLAPARPFGI